MKSLKLSRFSVAMFFSLFLCAAILPASNAHAGSWFKTEKIDDDTTAIKESHYYMQNISYLIEGSERSIMFDTGTGSLNLSPFVNTLTDKPVIAGASHMHYDHIKKLNKFEHVALADIPQIRKQTRNNIFKPTYDMYMSYPIPAIKVSEWWKPGDIIDLGGRQLEVVYLPGHTDNSIALIDHERKMVFCGDFLYPKILEIVMPTASIKSYLNSANTLLRKTGPDYEFFGGHFGMPSTYNDLRDLGKTLSDIVNKKSKGLYIFGFRIYSVNKNIILITKGNTNY